MGSGFSHLVFQKDETQATLLSVCNFGTNVEKLSLNYAIILKILSKTVKNCLLVEKKTVSFCKSLFRQNWQ